MQISLKDLFALTTFAAMIAAILAYLGASPNDFVVMHFIIAGLMAAIFVYMATGTKRRSAAMLLPVPFFLCGCLSMGIMFQAVLLIGVGCTNAYFKQGWSLRTITWITAFCFLAGIAVNLVPGLITAAKVREVRRRYPVESLELRLAYEKKRPASQKAPRTPTGADIDGEAGRNDILFYDPSRNGRLLRIHQEQSEQFVLSEGFGFFRMLPFTPDRLIVAPFEDIAFATKTKSSIKRFYDLPFSNYDKAFVLNNEETLHKISRNGFLNSESFGAVLEPLKKVIGFVPHGFNESPNGDLATPFSLIIDRLELVSLLKFDEPRVYVLDHLPRMDQLSHENVPTRPLNEFEATSLDKLWTEEEVVVTPRPRGSLMLGALRASNDCLQCHQVQRGTLLGAFSYEISEP